MFFCFFKGLIDREAVHFSHFQITCLKIATTQTGAHGEAEYVAVNELNLCGDVWSSDRAACHCVESSCSSESDLKPSQRLAL